MTKKNKQSDKQPLEESETLQTEKHKDKSCHDCANYVKPSRHREKATTLVPTILNIIIPPKRSERFERVRECVEKEPKRPSKVIDDCDNPFNFFGNCGNNARCPSPTRGRCSSPRNPCGVPINNCDKYYLRLSCESFCEIRVVNPKKSLPMHILTDRLVQNKMADVGFINNQIDGSVILHPGAFVSFIPIYDEHDRCAHWGIYGCGFESNE
ncbi:MAG: hypothetical protein Hyperionvirus9_57 [Hyperionvirus sp.]|uniref:Uncharacterized protein n=1 Tax=Hyperionvirus sp. TaxID=2487770 RepID=A0A3G5A8P4_9VIRU|nr:MAG: hypothetical protein Hyperionvirus9_57 [Hyperionvirus sp.]